MHPPLLQQAPSRHDRPTASGSSFRTHDHRTRQIGALSSGLSGHRPLNLLWRHPVLLRTSGDHGQSVGLPGTPRRPDGSTEGRERTRSAVPQAPPPVNDASQKHHGTAGSTHQGTLGAQDGLARASTMGAGTAIDSVAHGGWVVAPLVVPERVLRPGPPKVPGQAWPIGGLCPLAPCDCVASTPVVTGWNSLRGQGSHTPPNPYRPDHDRAGTEE
jgi:hypothetical protein